MKARKKSTSVRQKICEERKSERRMGMIVTVAILVAIISISVVIINSVLNPPSTNQAVSSTSEPKAAIVDQLSLTYPNQTFRETATSTLRQAGYIVDYYAGEEVTVEFYRNLPTHGYGLIILRVHSSAAELEGKEFVETPVGIFTSESYSQTKYAYEQLTDQLLMASYTMPQHPYYFAIVPKFVTSGMKGIFQNTIIIMMGCEGLNNTKMAEAFIQKGAKTYIGRKGSVLASHTDLATVHLLQHFVIEKQTLRTAINETIQEVGADPVYHSLLTYFPLETGYYTIQNMDPVRSGTSEQNISSITLLRSLGF